MNIGRRIAYLLEFQEATRVTGLNDTTQVRMHFRIGFSLSIYIFIELLR
jgi:hypothetical protein